MPSLDEMIDPRPSILLLSFDQQTLFYEHYANLLNCLGQRYRLVKADDCPDAVTCLRFEAVKIALVTDAGISRPEYEAALAALVNFVRAGGTAIIMGYFSACITPDETDRFFLYTWSLPWRSGPYHRTTSWLNPAVSWVEMNRLVIDDLDLSYSQEALHLSNVPHGSAVYLPGVDSRIERMGILTIPIEDETQTPVAIGAVGFGRLAYVGDVNGESGSEKVVIAMCGLMPV